METAKILPESQLDIFSFNADDFYKGNLNIEWGEKGKEFSYANKLFDVVKIKHIDNRILIFCINDVKEENILKTFCEYISTKSSHSNKLVCLLGKVPGYYFQEINYSLPFMNGELANLFLVSNCRDIIQRIHTPPPRLS